MICIVYAAMIISRKQHKLNLKSMMLKVYRTLCVSVTLTVLTCLTLQAQQRVVTGTIKDDAGTPMPGVSILLKGTTTGTAADGNGNFSIQVADTDVLVVSFIGYKTQEVLVGNKTTLDIVITEDLTTLSEVVVIGYGEQKKVLNTGANLQVKGEDIKKLSTTNTLQALQGQTPGVQITSTSGQPGEPLKVIIRGLGTIGSAGPLYVVDGVLTGDISYLNPADVESVDILKDAASAAIYGSQAANGVVLVTTKRGKIGTRGTLNFDSFYGIQNPARKAELLNSREYAAIMNEAAINSGKLPIFTNEQIGAMGKGTNWIDEMFVKDAPTQNYSLGASGATDASAYSLSLSYMSQAGIVGGSKLSNYERYSFRVNTEHKIYKDVLKVGQNLTFSYVEGNGIGVGNQYSNTLRGAFNTSPFVPMYDDEGNYFDNSNSTWNNGEANPYASMVYSNQNRRDNQKLIGNLYAEVQPIKNLKFRTSFGLDFNSYESRSFTPIYKLSVYSFNDVTRVNQSIGKGRTLLFDNTVSYSFDLAGDHHFDAMIGTSAFMYKGTNVWGTNTDLVFSDLEHAWLSNATNTDGTKMTLGGAPDNEDKRLSYFARLGYNFKETYMLNATFRADGSSRFAPGNRWGYFPSVSAGWVLTNESFLSSATAWLDFFKVRASWGQVGNLNVGFFQYLAPVTFANTNYIFGPEEGVLAPGAFPSRLSNPNVKWETSEQTNVGFDARFSAGRITMSFDWYTKTTKDWLIEAPVLATSGADAPFINGGNVKNSGIELALSYSSKVGDLSYTVGVNGAYNRNKVVDIPNQDGIVHGPTNQLYNNSLEFNRAQSGYPIGYFWGLETDGLFQTEEEVASYRSSEGTLIQPSAAPGDIKYIDRNDDGVIDDKDRTMIGNPNPDYTFGFSVSANYKGFDFSLLANGVAGNELVQAYRNHASQYANYTTSILDRWHGPGSSNTVPRVTENNSNWTNFSDLYIHKGDYLRIANVTLGYDFTNLIGRNVVSKVRLFASALNLYTFTKYDGMDPEVGYGVNTFSSGVDLGYYPRPRTYLIGLNVQF
jgi:TonB-dependent starch-binding outer membrane protein SusC